MLKPTVNVSFGGDPELFFERDGAIIGAEKVIPEDGLKGGDDYKPSVVLDGVQVELNPPAHTDLLIFGRGIATAFEMIERRIRKHEGVSISYKGVVEVSRAELDSLSPKSRILGCMPSFNIYGVRPITVDPKTYRKRSGGGHLHLGLLSHRALFNNREDIIPLFDIFVGNTCVMLDRDPLAAERRENYGRAGEYRKPIYGIEYRTLSNFWLRNYSLMKLVYGMAQIAISIVEERVKYANDIEAELIEMVNIGDVIKAIDTNNFELAKTNFQTIRPFLAKHLPERGFPLNPNTLDRFLTFADGVNTKGLTAFFPQDPAIHWIKREFVDFPEFLNTIY